MHRTSHYGPVNFERLLKKCTSVTVMMKVIERILYAGILIASIFILILAIYIMFRG